MTNYRERRLPCGMTTTAHIDGESRTVTITSVSETGCSLSGKGNWQAGHRIALNIRLPAVTGRVVRVDPNGCGAQFDNRLSYGDVTRIQEGVQSHKKGHRFLEMR